MSARSHLLAAMAFGAVVLNGCKQHAWDQDLRNDLLINGLSSPVRLSAKGPITVYLTDFVIDPSRIDSVTASTGFDVVVNDARTEATLSWSDKTSHIAELRIWSDGIASVVPLFKSGKQNVELTYSGPAKMVELKGEFTGWVTEKRFVNQNGSWKASLELDPGNYQYLLVIDGRELLHPANADSIDNGIGGFNSLLKVMGTPPDSVPTLITHTFTETSISLKATGQPTQLLVLWDNIALPSVAIKSDKSFVTIELPAAARSADQSALRVFCANSHGRGNDVLVPLYKGKPVTNPNQLGRTDWHTAQMYFMMVDRFVNGDLTNDEPLIDKDIHPKANYQGGDLEGVLQVLKSGYFDSLSVSTLWVSPITQNPLKGYVEFPAPHRKYSGYHGYWPIANTKVDHRFGTDQTLKTLVDAVHGANKNIILDFVSNHVHEDHPLVKAHPEWRTPLVLPDGRKNIRLWDEHRLTTWFDTFIPSLDHSISEVTAMLTDTALLWVRDKGFDGFRHDAAKHIPQEFWRELTRKVKTEVVVGQNRPVLQIGETFGSRELIGSYIGSGMMDGKFDFNLYFDARSALATGHDPMDRLAASIRATLDAYGHHHLMGNITGNHDLPRFISYASGALKFGEDEKEAGWNRAIEVTDTLGHHRLRQLMALMWTLPGIPVMYYGDEFGMAGAGDPDNRRMMRFNLNPSERKTLAVARKLAHLRKNSMALLYGDFTQLSSQGPLITFTRQYFNEAVTVVINNDSVPHTITLPINVAKIQGQIGADAISTGGKTTLTVGPQGFGVINGVVN